MLLSYPELAAVAAPSGASIGCCSYAPLGCHAFCAHCLSKIAVPVSSSVRRWPRDGDQDHGLQRHRRLARRHHRESYLERSRARCLLLPCPRLLRSWTELLPRFLALCPRAVGCDLLRFVPLGACKSLTCSAAMWWFAALGPQGYVFLPIKALGDHRLQRRTLRVLDPATRKETRGRWSCLLPCDSCSPAAWLLLQTRFSCC